MLQIITFPRLFNCVERLPFSYMFQALEMWPVFFAEICLKFEIYYVSAVVTPHINTSKYGLFTSICVFMCQINISFHPV